MSNRITQTEFDVAATAWTAFIGSAKLNDVQNLFQLLPPKPNKPPAPIQYQTFVSFDLADTIPQLLSTVGIRQVMARFVLAPPNTPASTPRFGIVLYAADERGGRISAYYQGDSYYRPILRSSSESTPPDLQYTDAPQGLVPFDLIHNWLQAWVTAAEKQDLSQAQFATNYGPLQGYNFEVGDFMDQLFTMTKYEKRKKHKKPKLPVQATLLYLNFGLKSYFPAYPETLTDPAQTFGLVVRLYFPPPKGLEGTAIGTDGGTDGGTESGPSYDVAKPYPPG